MAKLKARIYLFSTEFTQFSETRYVCMYVRRVRHNLQIIYCTMVINSFFTIFTRTFDPPILEESSQTAALSNGTSPVINELKKKDQLVHFYIGVVVIMIREISSQDSFYLDQ